CPFIGTSNGVLTRVSPLFMRSSAVSQFTIATNAVYGMQYARARLRSNAFQASGTFHSSSISGRAPFGRRSFRLSPVGSMNGLGVLWRATAVFHMRAYAPASMACRSQRGAVSHVYFSRQFCPAGFGRVCLFQG